MKSLLSLFFVLMLSAPSIASSNDITAVKSLPICRFVHGLFEDWNDCTGLYDFGNGYKYLGNWMRDRPNGWGLKVYEKLGYFYIGQFLHGEENGYGLSGYRFGSGSLYLGTHVRGDRNGWFTIFHPDGSKSIGQYVDDERHGMWLETDTDGNEYWYEYDKGEQVFPPTIYEAPERMEH